MTAGSSRRYYLGLAATLHDPALAIVDEAGDVVFAESTERWVQRKRAFNMPADLMGRTADLVRAHCGVHADLVVAVSWSGGFLQRLRLLSLAELPGVRSVFGPAIARQLARRDHLVWPLGHYRLLAQSMLSSLTQAGINVQWLSGAAAVRRYDHHRSHAALCLGSPFERAACAVVDGFGEWTSTSCFTYDRGRLTALRKPGVRGSGRRASLGMFYAAVCSACGFDPLQGEEWKVMGLAPYGEVDPDVYRLLRPLLSVDGLEIVRGCSRAEYAQRLDRLRTLTRPPERPSIAAADMARTGQQVFADVMAQLLTNLHRAAPRDSLVLAGGCALNSSWNGRVVEETPFRHLHVPAAPADDGTALGAALLAWSEDHPGAPAGASVADPYLGSVPSADTMSGLARFGQVPGLRRLPGRVARVAAELLARGRIIGWMQGRAEFGPRALGHRSILADPRLPDMKELINERVKFREAFRPFAPAILHEHGDEYFEHYQESRYMERALVFRAHVRDRVPAVVHVDGTGRLQTVRREWAPEFHELVSHFHDVTGVPIVLNTSFNVMGRPIVHSVEDALGAFFTTGLDALVVDDWLIEKEPVGA